MKEKLLELMNNAYAPYSKFKVAAIINMKDGSFFKGVNVENASYGATICAERNAILSAVTEGYKKGDFDKIYVMVSGDKLSTPCFMCRQVISEFFNEDDEIILMNKDGEVKKFLVRDLCPMPFNSDDL